MLIQKQRRAIGTSMIELLCVIAIISILAAIALGPMIKAFHYARHFLGH